MAYAKPLSNILLRVDKALNDEIITDSGIKLYIDGSYRKEWECAVTATIEELPLKVNPQEKHILDSLTVGDEIAMSYQVVADLEFKGDGGRFMQITEDNPYIQEYANGIGEWIRCYALPARKGIQKAVWVGVYLDKNRKLIDGCQGSESELSRWKSQFQFGKTDIYTHTNLFSYNNKDYWKADPSQIFAKKSNGHIVAIGNRVICRPIEEDVPADIKKSISYKNEVKIRYQDRGRVVSSNKSGIKKDYIIAFMPNHVEKYQLWGKDYFLINEKYIQGVITK